MGTEVKDSVVFLGSRCVSAPQKYNMKLTGLKHPKTTCFRGIVRENTQGNGSFQMVISCDCYQARELTLFKGQGVSVSECVCVPGGRMRVSVM